MRHNGLDDGALREALERWERVLSERFPGVLRRMNPGLDDDGVAALAHAVRPLDMPRQVKTLYRWRNGGPGVFGGWRLRPLDELLRWRRFCLEALGEPPAWLQLFDDECLAFVTLSVPGGQDDDAVWFGHPYGSEVYRYFGAIAELIQCCVDAAEAGDLHDVRGSLRLRDQSSLDGREFDPYRLARSHRVYRRLDPPDGTVVSRFPQPDWPASWLLSMGLNPAATRPRGATDTIEGLLLPDRTSPREGTIRARVIGLRIGSFGVVATVHDGTGSLEVLCSRKETILTPAMHDEVELDVVVTSLDIPTHELDADPESAQIMQRFLPTAPPAVAKAVRPLPDA